MFSYPTAFKAPIVSTAKAAIGQPCTIITTGPHSVSYESCVLDTLRSAFNHLMDIEDPEYSEEAVDGRWGGSFGAFPAIEFNSDLDDVLRNGRHIVFSGGGTALAKERAASLLEDGLSEFFPLYVAGLYVRSWQQIGRNLPDRLHLLAQAPVISDVIGSPLELTAFAVPSVHGAVGIAGIIDGDPFELVVESGVIHSGPHLGSFSLVQKVFG